MAGQQYVWQTACTQHSNVTQYVHVSLTLALIRIMPAVTAPFICLLCCRIWCWNPVWG
jgi:hypothetical protein